MKYCQNCGSQLQDSYKACPNCGAFVNNQGNINYGQPVQQGFHQQGFQPVDMSMYNQFQYGGNMQQENTKGLNIASTILSSIVLFFQTGYIALLSNGLGNGLKEYADAKSMETFNEAGALATAIAFIFVPLILDILVLIFSGISLKKRKSGLAIYNLIVGISSFVLMIIFAITVYNYFS